MPNSEIKIFTAEHLIPVEGDPLSPGALAVLDGKILELGAPESLKKKYPQSEIVDYSEQSILPGLVNAHADLSLTNFSGYEANYLAKDGRLHLMPWLVQVSRYKASLSIPEQQASMAKGLGKCRASGTTTLGDECRFPVAIPAYEKSGLRVVCMAEVENIRRETAQDDFEQALALVDEVLHAAHPRIHAGMAPFSAYTLSKNLLRILANHVLQQGIPMHLHAALSFSEMEFFYDSLGEISAVLFKEAGWQDRIPPPHHMTPVQYLHEIGVLKAKPSLVGCLHLGPTDAAILQNYASTRIYAPMAFEYLQVGEPPWKDLFKQKTPWALGTMSKAAGASLDLWDEMRTVLYTFDGEARESFAEWILRAATLNAAKTLNLDSQVGSLEAGKWADFLVVASPSDPANRVSALIDQTQADRIAQVYVAGEALATR